MTRYPCYFDFKSLADWEHACAAIEATDPAAQAARRALRSRLAAYRRQHEARMATCDRLAAATDAALKAAGLEPIRARMDALAQGEAET